MPNSARLAFLLKNSSLSSEEQQVVLGLLPRLSEGEVQRLFERLQEDYQAMAAALQSAHVQRGTIIQDFEAQLEAPLNLTEEA